MENHVILGGKVQLNRREDAQVAVQADVEMSTIARLEHHLVQNTPLAPRVPDFTNARRRYTADDGQDSRGARPAASRSLIADGQENLHRIYATSPLLTWLFYAHRISLTQPLTLGNLCLLLTYGDQSFAFRSR